MFNTLGFKPEFYVPCYKHTRHHLLPPSFQIPLWSTSLEVKFPRIQVEELMQTHLLFKLASVAFYPAQCAHLLAVLSAEIWDLVKTVIQPRYRLARALSTSGPRGRMT